MRGTRTTAAGVVVVVVLALAACARAPADAPAGTAPSVATPSAAATGSTPGTPTAPPTPSPSAAPAPASAVGVVESTRPGLPEGVDAPDGTERGSEVVPGPGDRRVQVVTLGSSTCPLVPRTVTWDAAAGALLVSLTDGREDGATQVCTHDLAWTTSVVLLPDAAPPATDVTVEVTHEPLG